MLTRIEIDGFKTFREFSVDLLPFQVVLGPNAVGKSNLFDGLHLLSRLSELNLHNAFQDLRGEPSEMFAVLSPGVQSETMQFAVELLIDPKVRDPWGVEVKAKHTRIRYELTIARRNGDSGIERLYVTKENAQPILNKDDRWANDHASRAFRDAYIHRGRQTPWLETTTKDGVRSFKIYQDARAGRNRPADAAESTVLSGVTSAEFPHLFALREELRSWRFLLLNPEGLRRPCTMLAPNRLTHDGSNLAAVLARIKNETRTSKNPKGLLADISLALAQLVPGVRWLDVLEDDKRREYRIEISMQDGNIFPSRVLSDGTLRILALVALMYDPSERGLICFEEPENGVHPFRLGQMVEMLRSLASNLEDTSPTQSEPLEPLKQILLNSHSPVVLRNLTESQMLFADVVTRVDPRSQQGAVRCTRLRRVQQALFESTDQQVTVDYVKHFLETATPEEEFAQ